MKKKELYVTKYIFICFLSLILLPFAASAQSELSVLSDGDDQLYSIDLQTGNATPIGPSGFRNIECLTFDPSGTILYGVNDDEINETDQLVTCDPSTGACTLVGQLNVAAGDCGLAFDCNGELFLSVGAGADDRIFYSSWLGHCSSHRNRPTGSIYNWFNGNFWQSRMPFWRIRFGV